MSTLRLQTMCKQLARENDITSYCKCGVVIQVKQHDLPNSLFALENNNFFPVPIASGTMPSPNGVCCEAAGRGEEKELVREWL